MGKAERNYWLDAMLGALFITVTVTGLTLWIGAARWRNTHITGFIHPGWRVIHIVASMIVFGGVVLHVAWHWGWLSAMRGRRLKDMRIRVRANRVTDFLVWVSFCAACTSGITAWLMRIVQVTDPYHGLTYRLHVITSLIWGGHLLVHLLLHSKWLISSTKHYLFERSGTAREPGSGCSAVWLTSNCSVNRKKKLDERSPADDFCSKRTAITHSSDL